MADIIEVGEYFFNLDKIVTANEGDGGGLWVRWEGEGHKKSYSGETAKALLEALIERSK